MSHTALVNGALFGFLAVMTLLLVVCIIAVILAPAQRAGSHTPQQPQGAMPSPPLPRRRSPATAPSPPLPRRRPPATAPTAGFHAAPTAGLDAAPAAGVNGRPAADDETAGLGALPPLPGRIERAEVSGGPPWGPAPEPPGLDS